MMTQGMRSPLILKRAVAAGGRETCPKSVEVWINSIDKDRSDSEGTSSDYADDAHSMASVAIQVSQLSGTGG